MEKFLVDNLDIILFIFTNLKPTVHLDTNNLFISSVHQFEEGSVMIFVRLEQLQSPEKVADETQSAHCNFTPLKIIATNSS